jgi:hypothetical protein
LEFARRASTAADPWCLPRISPSRAFFLFVVFMLDSRHDDEPTTAAQRLLRLALLGTLAGFVAVSPLLVASAGFAQAPVRSLREIRQEGVIIQQWDTSCGAAALATVLTYSLHDPVSEREVASGMLRMTEPLKVKHKGGFSLICDGKLLVERSHDPDCDAARALLAPRHRRQAHPLRRQDRHSPSERTAETTATTSAIVDLVFAALAASNISD